MAQLICNSEKILVRIACISGYAGWQLKFDFIVALHANVLYPGLLAHNIYIMS